MSDTFRSPRSRMAGLDDLGLGSNLVSEADKNFNKKASPAAKQAVAVATAAAKKTKEQLDETGKEVSMLDDTLVATYKIEIHYGAGRTPMGPNLLGLKVFESGKKFHGGGDEIMFWCRDTTPGSQLGCGGVIPSSHIKNGVGFCHSCNKGMVASKLSDMLVHRITTQNLANLVEKLFRKLGSKADVYCKYDVADIRYIAAVKSKGSKFARANRGKMIYPLKNIIKDTAAGASLNKRLVVFFSS